TGVVGLGLFALPWIAAIRSGVGARWMGPMGLMRPMGQVDPMSGYDLGPACALVGLVLAGATDAVHVNAQAAAMWLARVSVCPVLRVGKTPESSVRQVCSETGGAGL